MHIPLFLFQPRLISFESDRESGATRQEWWYGLQRTNTEYRRRKSSQSLIGT